MDLKSTLQPRPALAGATAGNAPVMDIVPPPNYATAATESTTDEGPAPAPAPPATPKPDITPPPASEQKTEHAPDSIEAALAEADKAVAEAPAVAPKPLKLPDVSAPEPAANKPVEADDKDKKSKKADKPKPAKVTKPPRQPGVGLAIFATVVVVLGIAALVTYAYLKTNHLM